MTYPLSSLSYWGGKKCRSQDGGSGSFQWTPPVIRNNAVSSSLGGTGVSVCVLMFVQCLRDRWQPGGQYRHRWGRRKTGDFERQQQDE